MSTQVYRVPQTGPVYRQLALPGWDVERRPQPLTRLLAAMPAQQVWASLSPMNQKQVRQTIVHILQEVLNEQH